MSNALTRVPTPINEPVRNYAPGEATRTTLQARLEQMAREKIEIPLVIGGKEIRTGNTRKVTMPHDHGHVLAEFHLAGPREIQQAIDVALAAKARWETLDWQERAGVFLKAADLLASSWRDTLNAATMLGQSKNVYQAEIDAACELIDFLRFNAYYYEQILGMQPISSPAIWNRVEYRPLDGFVAAIAPFNFTAIAANLPAVPAMLGNTVLWKPSDTQMLAAWHTMRLFEAAGLPAGVINFVPADGPEFGKVVLGHRAMSGIHFTGSTATFRQIWQTVGQNIAEYGQYPRLVGETGGKDFVFAHASADVEALTANLIRGAFEYQGQKCSAASRAYIPKSLWPKVKERMAAELATIRVGDVRDFSNFVNAVIDERSFKKITGYIDFAKSASDAKILFGGKSDASRGWFIDPTVVETTKPDFKTMSEEIFGPVLTVLPYEDAKLDETLEICDRTSPYALTGAIFAQDRYVVDHMSRALRNAAGNFYINDKPTGAVVGQQPFGGGRASGTNDKAGSVLNLFRWLSARTVKENLQPPRDYRYPFLAKN